MITTRSLAALILGASVAALAGAFFAQYVMGLEPCPLCLYQRFPYAATLVLGALALASKGRWPLLAIALAGAVFAGEAALAFYHVGVERHWWAGLDACAQAGATPGTVDELRTLLLEEPPPPPCDQVPWSLFGLSMAGYNMLYAGVMAAISLAGPAALHRKAGTK